MSQQTLAALVTTGCIAVLVLWIPAVCLTQFCVKALVARLREPKAVRPSLPAESVSAYLMSGTRHEQE